VVGKEEKAARTAPAAFIRLWLPTVDNLRNFFSSTDEVLKFLPTDARSIVIKWRSLAKAL
jgi:hypothetical protein